jgi:hypothetical protein
MRYFVDTEFIEDGKTIDLISIGIVDEDGREFYSINHDCNFEKASDWVKTNVLNHLEPCKCTPDYWNPNCAWAKRLEIRIRLKDFIGDDPRPEFWGYYCDYDWVAICQLFGTMMDLPKGWPYFMYDLRQWLNHIGAGFVSQPDDMPHHALSDARWIAKTYKACR